MKEGSAMPNQPANSAGTVQARICSRRDFHKAGAVAAAAGFLGPYWFTAAARAEKAAGDLRFGAIGVGGRGAHIARAAIQHGATQVAIADVDDSHAAKHKQDTGDTSETYNDYHQLLDRSDIDIVSIGTPDHWHAKIAIDAMRAGKDVYCEKPLTLTIDEGKLIRKVLQETGRVFQVGTQQRSEFGSKFLLAVALCHAGRLGPIRRITCVLGAGPTGGPFQVKAVPTNLDWNLWLGQAPKTPFIPERCHNLFRWWYEYAGGKITDWGAHHVDIAYWALGSPDTESMTIKGAAELPNAPNTFNTPEKFDVTCTFGNSAEIRIVDEIKNSRLQNGLLIEGSQDRLIVNRGRLSGGPVDRLRDDPLPEDALLGLYKGKQPGDHMKNFLECVKDRNEPVSDVASHHRALTICHLANIAIRLGRQIQWDPDSEQIVADEEANGWLKRTQRMPYACDS